MCGIAGIVGFGRGDAMRATTCEMVAGMGDRGPDATDVWAGDGVAIGSARLALLDPDRSHQPMLSGDGRFVLAYNGEIFNHGELRASPELRDWRFHTAGDTELVLALVAVMGLDALALLDGQFAGALLDRETGELILFRDRFGIVPLYYARLAGGGLAFASTLRALLVVPGWDSSLDPLALRQVMTFWAPVAPSTSLSGALQLAPGHALRVRDGRARVERWRPSGSPRQQAGSFESQVVALREELTAAVDSRLQADSEVGVLVSGGVDSAVIAALASSSHGQRRTWSVTFDDPEHDESVYQHAVVDRVDSLHTAVDCTPETLAEVLPAVVAAAETSFLRFAPCSSYLLAGSIGAAGVRAVLSGEGADEAFFGYDLFKETLLMSSPGAVLAGSDGGGTPAERVPEPVRRLMLSDREIDPRFASHAVRWRAAGNLTAYLRPELLEDVPDPLDALAAALPPEFDLESPLQRAQQLELLTFLPGYLLSTQGDRMFMAHSVETRYPFLSDRVFDLALTMPDEAKLDLHDDKRVLRAAAAGLLPDRIATRPKQAYRAPVAAILRSPAGADLVDDLLDPTRVVAEGVFRPERVAWLVKRLRAGVRLSNTQEMALACVLTTHLWQRAATTARTDPKELIA